MFNALRYSRTVWLVVGLLGGLILGGFWPHTPLHAVATDRYALRPLHFQSFMFEAIPDADVRSLAEGGVGRLFGPGTPLSEVAEYIRATVESRRAGRAS